MLNFYRNFGFLPDITDIPQNFQNAIVFKGFLDCIVFSLCFSRSKDACTRVLNWKPLLSYNHRQSPALLVITWIPRESVQDNSPSKRQLNNSNSFFQYSDIMTGVHFFFLFLWRVFHNSPETFVHIRLLCILKKHT